MLYDKMLELVNAKFGYAQYVHVNQVMRFGDQILALIRVDGQYTWTGFLFEYPDGGRDTSSLVIKGTVCTWGLEGEANHTSGEHSLDLIMAWMVDNCWHGKSAASLTK